MTKFIFIGINVLKTDLQQKDLEKMKMKKKIETKYQTKIWKGHNNDTMFYE